jgi:hypothetical protein
MTRWRGWATAHGIVRAFHEGRIKTRGDITAVKTLITQADREQVAFVYDHVKEYLTPFGRREIFGRRPSASVQP